MMNFACLILEKHQQICVKTFSGIYYGKFGKISSNECRLELLEVKNEMQVPIGRFKYFYSKDVIDVEVVNGEGSTLEVINDKLEQKKLMVEVNEKLEELHINLSEAQVSQQKKSTDEPNFDEKSSIKSRSALLSSSLSTQQLQKINQTVQNNVLLNQADSKYFEYLAEISKHFVIGLAAEGCLSGRIYKINFLTISTSERIYNFDLFGLKAEKAIGELKLILENETQLKLVHDFRGMQDNFKTNLNINIRPVFDLMLVAAQFHPPRKVLKLYDCAESVLGSNFNITQEKIFMKRPLQSEDLSEISTKIAFHIPMYHKLIQKILQNNFQKAFEDFCQYRPDNESFIDEITSREDQKTLEKVVGNHSNIDRSQKIDFSVYTIN